MTGDLLNVRHSRRRPRGSYVSVNYRGHWFSIDDDDLESKSSFSLLGQLFALQAGGIEVDTPVLTISVGGDSGVGGGVSVDTSAP